MPSDVCMGSGRRGCALGAGGWMFDAPILLSACLHGVINGSQADIYLCLLFPDKHTFTR